MPGPHSVYSITQSDPPEWMPGEELAAAAFIAMAFLLVLEVNLEIFRIFRRRKGLYFWAMTIGSWACALDAIGMSVRFLSPGAQRTWPLQTLFMSVGWATYTVAQLTVLFSRLHLVCDNHTVHRAVLLMILIFSPIIIITDWVTVWGAYNPRTSSTWSPRHAIVERFAQLGFTIMEVITASLYCLSLMQLLRMRSSVRQRRVMLDLIYVLILVVSLDIINVVLVFLNQVGLSHPIQTFSYILKLRLEFLVLNQLMAVAARGMHRETFGEKRYHDPQALMEFSMFGPGGENTGTSNGQDRGSGDQQATRDNSIIIALPSISPESSTTRHPSFPASATEPPPAHTNGLTKSAHEQTRRAWLPITYDRVKHKKSGEERMLPQGRRKPKNRTMWRNDEDENDDDDAYVGYDEWENQGSTTLQVPWFRTSPRGPRGV